MHLLTYVVGCTVSDSPFITQANCWKCPPSASINFLTRLTRELVTSRSTAALLMLLAVLRIPVHSRPTGFLSRTIFNIVPNYA